MPENASLKILIVEDIEGVLEILGEKLAREGFSVSLARDGKAGLDRALQENPDLIVSDILMPEMDGLDMVRKLRQDSRTAGIPVVFLSVLNENEYSHRLQGLDGILAVLWKNELSLQEAVERIKAALRLNSGKPDKREKGVSWQGVEVLLLVVGQLWILAACID